MKKIFISCLILGVVFFSFQNVSLDNEGGLTLDDLVASAQSNGDIEDPRFLKWKIVEYDCNIKYSYSIGLALIFSSNYLGFNSSGSYTLGSTYPGTYISCPPGSEYCTELPCTKK